MLLFSPIHSTSLISSEVECMGLAFVAIYKTFLKSFDAEIIDKVWYCDLVKIKA